MKFIFIFTLISICVVKAFAQSPTMMWRETLNFTWQGRNILVPNTTDIDNVNNWHLSKRTILTDAYAAGGRPNFAVTRIGIIYSPPQDENLYVRYIDVPFLFSSGWSEPIGARDNQALARGGTFSQRIQNATGCPPARLRFLSDAVTRTLHFENNTNGNDFIYCTHLVSVFSGNGKGAYLHPPYF